MLVESSSSRSLNLRLQARLHGASIIDVSKILRDVLQQLERIQAEQNVVLSEAPQKVAEQRCPPLTSRRHADQWCTWAGQWALAAVRFPSVLFARATSSDAARPSDAVRTACVRTQGVHERSWSSTLCGWPGIAVRSEHTNRHMWETFLT